MKKNILSSVPMELVSAVVFKEKFDDLAARLIALGLFHPVDLSDIEDELKSLSASQATKEYQGWLEYETQLNDLSKDLGVRVYARREFENVNNEEVTQIFSKLKEKIEPILRERDDTLYELKKNETFLTQLKTALDTYPFRNNSTFSFIQASIGKIDERNTEVLQKSLEDIVHVLYPFSKDGKKVTMIFIGLRRDKPLIEKVLRDVSWEEVKASDSKAMQMPEHVAADIVTRISECKNKLSEINEKIENEKVNVVEDLTKIKTAVLVRKSLFEIKRYSCSTEKTAVIAGWVPEQDKDKVIEEIKRVAPVSYIEATQASDINIAKEDIPIKLQHNSFLKPFAMLMVGYGLPRYGSIDPTFFVAFSFLIMFGVMFADIGHGLVLSLIGFFIRNNKKESVKQSASLLFYCGISSIIFGAIFGSIFGREFPALWIKPIHDISAIFKASIFLGVMIISVGVVLNIVNALRDKNYLKVFLDKSGFIAALIYWAGIGLVSKVFASKAGLPIFYIVVVGVGLFAFFLKPFLEVFIHKKKESFIVLFMEGLIEMIEVIMGYLASTVSFIRVAAFSLAHAGLFIAIFELSRLVQGVGGGILSLLLIIFGNIFVIILEGIVVTIQSLRLNYYEFFSKFFLSGKKQFTPLKFDD